MSHPVFESILPLTGKTWRGVFANSTPEKPVVDVSRWDLALNGQVVRILHSINDGEYGGETIIFRDEADQLAYFYFTTAGFHTRGTISFVDGKMVTHERVTGNANGITEVKGITEILPDGRMLVRTDYCKNGEWIAGRETLYEEAPGAEVKFKSG